MPRPFVNPNSESTKTHSFMRPLDHIRRRKIETCLELTHRDKPTYFATADENGISRYRAEYKEPTEDDYGPQQTALTLRKKSHPLQVYHLSSLDPDQTAASKDKNSLPLMDLRTWNSLVHRPFDPEEIRIHRRTNIAVKRPAIGIVPATRGLIDGDDEGIIVDPWLPATLALSTAIAVNKPYQYLPRRRKIIKPSLSSAGIRGAKVPDEDRFFHPIKPRPAMKRRITVRVK